MVVFPGLAACRPLIWAVAFQSLGFEAGLTIGTPRAIPIVLRGHELLVLVVKRFLVFGWSKEGLHSLCFVEDSARLFCVPLE